MDIRKINSVSTLLLEELDSMEKDGAVTSLNAAEKVAALRAAAATIEAVIAAEGMTEVMYRLINKA